VRGTWGAEAGALGTGDPNFGQFRLIAKKFSDYVLVSNELVADSPISVEAILKDLLREGLGFFEDCSFLSGTGVGEPKGVLNCGALISGERTSTGHVVYDDLVNMQSRLFPSSWKRAVWVASPAVFPDLAKMSVAVGTGGSAIWINGFGSNMANAAPQTLLGRPLIISEKVPTLGTAGDIMLCDFSYYIIGDRMQMALTSSDQVAFATDQTAFRIIERLDGAPWIDSALTPKNGGATLSAFITLAA
jgi:HK97 family phage major capsid protein